MPTTPRGPADDYETLRQRAAAQLCGLENTEDEVFELIVALVCDHFQAPIALISIVDEQRQWFSAKVGVNVSGTPRSMSFCAHTLETKQFLEVEDACLDDRFRDNPLVTGYPGIRYYAGAPLLTDNGLVLGALCVIDTKPRSLMSERDRCMLQRCSTLVMKRIDSLRYTSFVDQPTGLFNRSRVEQDIRQGLARGEDKWLVAADMVTTSFLNDIVKALGYGFTIDLVLEITRRLVAVLPKSCILYKISPTRFAFLWPCHEPVESICEAIVADFVYPVECHGIPVQMNIGLGISRVNDHCDKTDDWVRTAVTASEDARQKGVTWALYQPELDAAQQRAFRLLSSLSEAVRMNGQLTLAYQPRISLKTSECTSVEALIRWQHPTLGAIGPAEFIPLAEKTALIRPLSIWVMQSALKQVSEWQYLGHKFKVAMNVTPEDLSGPAFIDLMFETMLRCDVGPEMFELEFTESALISNPNEVRRQLNRVREAGMEVAIDDFGTGYSNWTYLRQLPATTVKLDQSLIRNLHSDVKDQRLVQTLITLAKSLEYRVVAEGLETVEDVNLVRDWGCDEGQGYFIGRPMAADMLLEWLSEHSHSSKPS